MYDVMYGPVCMILEYTCVEGQLELPRHFWVNDSFGWKPGIWRTLLIIIYKNNSGFPPTLKTILWLLAELKITTTLPSTAPCPPVPSLLLSCLFKAFH